MSADPAAVINGQSVKLVCAVMQADYPQLTIMFARRTRDKPVVCGNIFQHSSKCEVTKISTKYLGSCGSGTNTNTSKIKKYGLDIVKMELVDFTEWWCENIKYKQQHNSVTLTEISK